MKFVCISIVFLDTFKVLLYDKGIVMFVLLLRSCIYSVSSSTEFDFKFK